MLFIAKINLNDFITQYYLYPTSLGGSRLECVFPLEFKRVIWRFKLQYLSIVILILLPIAYLRYDATGSDGFTSVIGGAKYIVKTSATTTAVDHKTLPEFFSHGVTGLTKFLGWSLIPSFIIFAPVGFILFFPRVS